MECNLKQLGEKYDPTKRFHDYLKHYSTHLRDIRFDVKKILEIGVQSHCSVQMWREYFPNAEIHGMDIDPNCKSFESERITIHIGDQGSETDLKKVADAAGNDFDVIIDDGSHQITHQILTFETLFPTLSTHGIYVLEDTGPLVGDHKLATVNSLIPLIGNIFYWPPDKSPQANDSYKGPFPESATWADKNTVGIAFYRWIAFIMRGNNPDDNPYIQAY